MKITCILSPPIPDLSGYVAVVVDVLRSTSTLSVILSSNAKRVLLFDDFEKAVEQKLYNPKIIPVGENGNDGTPEFYSSKSTSEFIGKNLKGKEIAFSTSNGTNAIINTVDMLGKVFIGSMLNLTATAEALAKEIRDRKKSLAVICSGMDGRVALDDLYVAGSLIHKTIAVGRIRGFEIDDGVSIAKMVHGGFSRPIEALLASESGKRLSSLSMTSDIALCAKIDLMPGAVIATKEDGQYIVSYDKEDE